MLGQPLRRRSRARIDPVNHRKRVDQLTSVCQRETHQRTRRDVVLDDVFGHRAPAESCQQQPVLRVEVAEVLENRSHPATSLLNRKVIEDLLARPLGTTSSLPERAGLERARSISAWVKDYGVVLDL